VIRAVGYEMSTCFKFRMAQGILPKSREALPENWDLARMNLKYMCLCVRVCSHKHEWQNAVLIYA
jgi:hypothetical protein